MRLTKRDKEILKFINASGWCIAPQIEKRFSIRWWIVYRIMKRLTKAGLAEHKRVYFDDHGIFYLSHRGARYTDLPSIDGISKGIYDHQRTLVDVILKLRELYPDAKWVSERYLKQQKFYYGVGKLGHVADGVLIFPDDRKVAIEVELSIKGKLRIEKIFRAYAAQVAIREVWYFCADNVMPALSAMSAKKPFIKVHSLKSFLA